MTTNIDVEELAKKYQGFIQEDGRKCKDPVKDEDGDTILVFGYEGLQLAIIFDQEDTQFVRIILPNFYDVDDNNRLAVLGAISDTNRKCKGAKVFLNADNSDTTASIEFLETGNSIGGDELMRYCSMVFNAAKVYGSRVMELMS